jgi:hypothetical protein
MTWDLFVADLPQVKRAQDLPGDYRPRSLGSRSALQRRILEVLPEVDFTDPAWGVLETTDCVIQFSMASDPVDAFALHVRAGRDGAAAVPVISRLLACLSLRALDPASPTGLFQPVRIEERSS